MPMFERSALNTVLSLTAIGLFMTPVLAENAPIVANKTPVEAKLLILPGGAMPAGVSDVDSLAREISLDGALEGSSSHNAENNQIDLIDDAALGKTALGISKPRKSSIAKRKSVKVNKKRVKIARISIPRSTVKRRAPLMMGVYR